MEHLECWGTQIGGIQAPSTGTDSLAALDDPPEHFSVDHTARIEDFMRRHGGPATKANRQGRIDAGSRGWSEIYAADGYVLRTEWSRSELRGTMSVSEHPASFQHGPDGL
jgi:hypothetical protein